VIKTFAIVRKKHLFRGSARVNVKKYYTAERIMKMAIPVPRTVIACPVNVKAEMSTNVTEFAKKNVMITIAVLEAIVSQDIIVEVHSEVS